LERAPSILLLAEEFKRWKQPAAGMEHIIDPSVAGFSFQRIAEAHLEAKLIVERVDGGLEGEHRTSFQNQDTITGPSKSA
jgi:hypothetical protein